MNGTGSIDNQIRLIFRPFFKNNSQREHMQKITVSSDECYCGLVRFYDNVAANMGIDPDSVEKYDVRCINVSNDIQDILIQFMRDKGYDDISIGMALADRGPKVDSKLNHMSVEVFSGFITMKDKVSSKCIKRKTDAKKASAVKKPVLKKKSAKPKDKKPAKKIASKELKTKKDLPDPNFGTVLGIMPKKKQ